MLLDTVVAFFSSRKGETLATQKKEDVQVVRLVSVEAGHFRLAVPVAQVHQIVGARPAMMGDMHATEPEDIPRLNLAEALGGRPRDDRAASLVLQGPRGPLLAEVCGLHRFLEVFPHQIRALPNTVVTRWPGLVRGVVRHEIPHVLLDGNVLGALLQAWLDEETPQGTSPTAGGLL
jgi:chemotaxis signal transduction protein